MAFNIIKGKVQFSGDTQGTIEDMVDDHSDQTIGGTKTFSNIVTASAGLSASFFYGDGTNLTGITQPAIVTYDGAATNRLIVGSYNNNVVSGAAGLSYDGSSLDVVGDVTASAVVSASAFHGSAANLKSIPTDQFAGSISAADLNLGNGLTNSGGNLSPLLASNSGLALGAGGLSTDVSSLTSFTSLDNADSVPVYDNDASATKRATITTLATHIRSNFFSLPAGTVGNLQFHNGSSTFGNSDNLNFNSTTDTLQTITGSFRKLQVEGVNGNQTLFTLNKSQNSASYIEFRNEGAKYAEIFGTSAETLIMRTTTTGSSLILRQHNDDLLTFNNGSTTFGINKVTINQDLTVTGSSVMSSSVTIVTNSTQAIPQLHIHENDNEYGRISFTNNADTTGSIMGYSHEWTLAGSSSVQGSQTDARFNIWYGDAQGDGNGLDLMGINGIGDTAIKGTLALNCYQEDGTTSKVDPSTLVGHAHIYSKLVTGHAEMFVRDSNGNVTQISPHTPEGEWQYFSRNTRTGKVVRVNMERMIRKLEEITGESFMEEWYEEPTD